MTVDKRYASCFAQDTLWTQGSAQFATWIRSDGNVYISKRARPAGTWQAPRNLRTAMGNPLALPGDSDTHKVVSLGVDSGGRVHLSANQHYDDLRYMVTDEPFKVGAGWSSPVLPASTAAWHPRWTTRVTYPTFVRTSAGLLFFRREGWAPGGHWYLDLLPEGATAWTGLGAPDGPFRGVILRGEGTNAYPHTIVTSADLKVVHLFCCWRYEEVEGTGAGLPVPNRRFGYIRSMDGGLSWETIVGVPLVLPVREIRIPQIPGVPDLMLNQGGACVDADGKPHALVAYRNTDDNRPLHVWWDGTNWRTEYLPRALLPGRPSIAGFADGSVWGFSAPGGKLTATNLASRETREFGGSLTVPPGFEVTYDKAALRDDDRVEVLVADAVPVIAEFSP